MQGETNKYQAQRNVCQRHANMSKKGTASEVLPKSLSELTSMSDENVRGKPNATDGTGPIKYKLWTKTDVQYNAILSKKLHGGGGHPHKSKHIVAGLSHSTRTSDISKVSLCL